MRQTAVCCAAVAILLALLGCGDDSEPPPRFAAVLGGNTVPGGGSVVDAGVLADQTTYQPAASGRRGAEDAEGQVRELIDQLVAAYERGDAFKIVGAFGDQVAALEDAMLERGETERFFVQTVEDKFGLTAVEQLRSVPIQEFRAALSVQVIDADHVKVTPNLFAALVLGPRAAESMVFAQRDGKWRIELEQPLSDEDVDIVKQHHARVMAGLNTIAEAIEDGTIATIDEVVEAHGRLLTGQELGLTSAPASQPDSAPSSADVPPADDGQADEPAEPEDDGRDQRGDPRRRVRP